MAAALIRCPSLGRFHKFAKCRTEGGNSEFVTPLRVGYTPSFSDLNIAANRPWATLEGSFWSFSSMCRYSLLSLRRLSKDHDDSCVV